MRLVLGLWLVALPSVASAATTVEGTVFADVDGNGLYSAGDRPLAGVSVFWETTVVALTDEQGRYTLTAPLAGIVWARTPDGFSPAPSWKPVPVSGRITADLALVPSTLTGPASFIQASDTHVGVVNTAETSLAVVQAALEYPEANFLVITGDITQGNTDAEFAILRDSLEGLAVPFVPVIGNHDRYDGGGNYRKYLGPPTYSFDAGGAHFIVFDYVASAADLSAFLARDLAGVPEGTKVAAFVHAPPDPPILDALTAAGIDYLFTGHWHSNRVIEHPGFLEYNTEPFVMGGIDFTPAGYRLIAMGDGRPAVAHHNIVEEPVLEVVHPLPGTCVAPGPLELIVAAEGLGAPGSLVASVDGQPAVALDKRGGWTQTATVLPAAGTDHTLVVTAEPRGGIPVRVESSFCIAPPPSIPAELPDWSQHQGGAQHHGYAETPVVPPLTTVWARTVGGHLRGGSPALAGGRLFVPVLDLAGGDRGGVVALDARTGERLWEVRPGPSVHNTPAVENGLVVFGSADGVVRAVRAESGEAVWTVDLGAELVENVAWLYAGPTIAEGMVYIGLQRRFAAIDLATGVPMWEVDPSPNGVWLGSFASAAVSEGVAIAAFSRGADGVVAWDAYDGAELWRRPPPYSTGGVNTSPIIDQGLAFFGNGETVFFAVDLQWAEVRWQRKLVGAGFDWGYGLPATPALGGGRHFIPTHHEYLFALDAQSGAELWNLRAQPSVIHPVHYRAEARAFSSSPVATGEIVWVGGSDGILRALDGASGTGLWSQELGAPIMSGPVPSSCMLFVATWDGTVRAMASQATADGGACPSYVPPPPSGCDCRTGGRASVTSLLPLALVLAFRRRRRENRL